MASSITRKEVRKGIQSRAIKIQWVTFYGHYFDTRSQAQTATREYMANAIMNKLRDMRTQTCGQMKGEFNDACLCEQCMDFDSIIDSVEDLGNV